MYNIFMAKFVITELNADNFGINSLDDFIRRQKVAECWRKVNGVYALTPVEYTEDASLIERRKLAKRIIDGVTDGCASAFGAEAENRIVGFALIDRQPFGSRKQYVDLVEFHVSEPFRRRGIGVELFAAACREAKRLGAGKLYISAHSARETIAAYESYGCTFAEEINPTLAEKEPFDLQLECALI